MISWSAFFISFFFGMLYIYLSYPKKKVITVYSTQDNESRFNFVDKAHNCFMFNQNFKQCPKDDNNLKVIPIQT